MIAACSVHVRGVVQGVGFRPFVFRLAQANALAGWVLNEENGVDIHLEGDEPALESFLRDLSAEPPPAAQITAIEVLRSEPAGLTGFTIRESRRNGRPTVRISPDLPVCGECLAEMRDPSNPRYAYPYINCTNCGPRYTVIERLPYDRPNTTMHPWIMDALCSGQYHDPMDRRFHAQPIACPSCGPRYSPSIAETVAMLHAGKIVAVKGIGGYHLACDARNRAAVRAMRERKYRKEKPFAVMVRDLDLARTLVHLTADAEALLQSPARPIVLAPKKIELPEIAPDNNELGVMLPYAPLHHLLFDQGAPDVLVMTSANRSSEPIAYRDADARERLSSIAEAFLIGERPIARRVDDSVARVGPFGPTILRRSRGYAPGAVCTLPAPGPILAVGADLKNTITLVAHGQAFVSQHIGDLEHYESLEAFRETIHDLTSMYEVNWDELLVVHDLHPQYFSSIKALELPAARKMAVQHHRAHISSVLAEREAWDKRVIGVSFDGTGYGDDGSIWGGEFFRGSVAQGFERVMHLRSALLPGGDAAARHPVQCAAGFLAQLDSSPAFDAAPFHFPKRYYDAMQLVKSGVRTFSTTSMGRLFDTAAALLGFTREITFEGQAAMWLEYIAETAPACEPYPFPVLNNELDFRPLLASVIEDRLRGLPVPEVARAFQRSIADTLCQAAQMLCEANNIDTVVLSGGVFQNNLLLAGIESNLEVWTNSAVPANDGGISLGQAALGCFEQSHA
ncbi:MAG: carbamoyltransferase HypF [Bryobacteraceae bacterium]